MKNWDCNPNFIWNFRDYDPSFYIFYLNEYETNFYYRSTANG